MTLTYTVEIKANEQTRKGKVMTYKDAILQLPIGVKWSSSFGNPGCPGYVEYWRDFDNRRWNVCNGTHESEKNNWHVNQISDTP